MRTLRLDEVTEGAVIAADIVSDSGRCLVKKGTAVTSALIKGLRKYGIENIPVMEEEEAPAFTEEDISRAEGQCRDTVMRRFGGEPSDTMMHALFTAALRIEAEKSLTGREK